ncbi:unnamed protein product [Ostreobium quekettii]|uniref:Bacterial type II secretion system protein E domain-containing protein n=1 Tax=Ostreobium quekettii TaxID=121088 RepID=A0A8S1IKG6_9CHLO|nr:unnamed protein product [Ostreobium quekettii]
MRVNGFQGGRLVNSFTGGDAAVGTLTSPQLTITHDYVHLLIGGGGHAGLTCVNLLVDGQPARTATGPNLAPGGSEELQRVFWDVKELRGQRAAIQVVDRHAGGWGHINVDDIHFSDQPLGLPAAQLDPTARLRSFASYQDVGYDQPLRPQFHFTSRKNWLNDPNGMVFLDGEYHLFFQHNPLGNEWGNMTWGHAVSPDMLHWRQLPHALLPYGGGTIYSGTAVIDRRNTLGAPRGEAATMVAAFTHARPPFTQALAYSTDRGRTFQLVDDGKPVVANQGYDPEERDPKVFYHEESGQWVMALWVQQGTPGRVLLFNSPDLKNWTEVSRFDRDWVFECMDLVRLPVDGDPDHQKWLIYDASFEYEIGEFDGQQFSSDRVVQRGDFGPNYYAGQTFNDSPDGRSVIIGWMRGVDEVPFVRAGMPFNMQMSFPATMELRTTRSGLRLFRWPIDEITSLYAESMSVGETALQAANDKLADFEGELLDFQIKFAADKQTHLVLVVRGQEIEYRDGAFRYAGASLPAPPVDGAASLRVLVDRASVELFANGGAAVSTHYADLSNIRMDASMGEQPAGANEGVAASQSAVLTTAPEQVMTNLLNFVSRTKASDLHIKTGYAPTVRVGGHLRKVQMPAIPDSAFVNSMVLPLAPEGRLSEFDKNGSLDFSTQIAGGDRFRINIFKSRGETHVAMRRVQSEISDFNDLHLPDVYRDVISKVNEGLVLVCGVTGSGKSSTMAAMVDYINHNRGLHIITIEDPIEFHFEGDRSIISQREVGVDVRNFADALRVVVRQDPDMILIGEMRDRETVLAAIQAAETGHLVLGSLHCADVPLSFARILEFFDRSDHAFVRSSLANSLRAIMCQRLLPGITEGSRYPATEVMLNNSVVQRKIMEEEDEDLHAVLHGYRDSGMRDFAYSLFELVEQDKINRQVAMDNAPNRDAFSSLLKGIDAAASGIIPVSFEKVRLQDAFWLPRLETQRRVLTPYAFEKTEEALNDLRAAAALLSGEELTNPPPPHRFRTSDLFKVMEGAAYLLAIERDERLEAQMDAIADVVAGSQEPDGYLNATRTLYPHLAIDMMGDGRYTYVDHSHELYIVGHLYEAAVAYYRATGKRKLLDVAERNAHHVRRVFFEGDPNYNGGEPINQAPGHQEIELALVRLFDATGNAEYLDTARRFLDIRGVTYTPHGQGVHSPTYAQQHRPVAEQQEPTGHAVRATYLYSGMADVGAMQGGDRYDDALRQIWASIVHTRMHITGGLGAVHGIEGFGPAYELPNADAFNETCAAVGNVFFNWRMFLKQQDAKFLDVAELALYNNALAGMNLGGDRFFYVNPLAADGWRPFNHGRPERSPWFGTACCPTNLARLIPQVPGMLFATDQHGLSLCLYAACSTETTLGGVSTRLTEETDYPFEGKVRLRVEPASAARFAVRLRIPTWTTDRLAPGELYHYAGGAPASKPRLLLNGQPIPYEIERGFAVVEREWSGAEELLLELPTLVRANACRSEVEANRGRVAVSRGPLVYCLESADNPLHAFNYMSTPKQVGSATTAPLTIAGQQVASVTLPAEALAADGVVKPTTAVLAPYFAWNNRGVGSMAVWLPDNVTTLRAGALQVDDNADRFASAEATHTFDQDSVLAMIDGRLPKHSFDTSIPRWTSWPQRGEPQTLTFELSEPTNLRTVQVYWYDDHGGVQTPIRWELQVPGDDGWAPFPLYNTDHYAVAADQYNVVHPAEPLTVERLRLRVWPKPDAAVGLLEVVVEPETD